MTISVSVIGATGRMGKLTLDIVEAAQDLRLHSALDSRSDLSASLGADVIFEATKLEVSQQVVEFAIANNQKVLVASSGWTQESLMAVEGNLAGAAVVVIPNFSVGSVLASKFAAAAAKYFESIEIIETHHAGKTDSPSGTAIRTAELIQAARQQSGKTTPLIQGLGQAARGQAVSSVPIHSLRIEGTSAKQDVVLGGNQEVLTLSHQANSVQAYAMGILESIRYTAAATGLTVGLDKVLGL